MRPSFYKILAGSCSPIIASALLLSACTDKDRDVSKELVKPLSDSETILEYSGGKITAADVRDRMNPHFEKARESLLNAYVRAANDVLFERNQASSKGPEVELSEQELQAYMLANKIPDTQKEQIRGFLLTEKNRLAKEDQKRTLFESMKVQNKLGAARFDVESTSSMPQFGPSGAKVTVQVFCDFANPICNRTRLLMASLSSKHGEKFRYIYRFFPVASNPGGTEAALAALCAHDQGRFWIAHDRLLDLGPTLPTKDLAEVLAADDKLDRSKLEACIRTDSVKKRLDAEVAAATALGITSTPVFFVNGTKIDNVDSVEPAIEAALLK